MPALENAIVDDWAIPSQDLHHRHHIGDLSSNHGPRVPHRSDILASAPGAPSQVATSVFIFVVYTHQIHEEYVSRQSNRHHLVSNIRTLHARNKDSSRYVLIVGLKRWYMKLWDKGMSLLFSLSFSFNKVPPLADADSQFIAQMALFDIDALDANIQMKLYHVT